MSLRDVFARNLRRLRHAKGFSQEELASRASISREYLGSLERSGYAASIDVIEGLAAALQVEPVHLLERSKSSRS
jgi:transcriptional regulator with XRE-family HTH domain